ncbi:MAG: hypothetical protein WCA46_25840 [Actinocatenispora sp.]
MKYVLAVLVAALGIAVILYGGSDDSPGAQLIGLVLVVGAAAFRIRAILRSKRP